MNVILKFGFILALLMAFIVFICVLFIDNLLVQSLSLLAIIVLNLVRFSLTEIYKEIRLFIPFIFTMMAMYVLLGLIGMSPGTDNAGSSPVMVYWIKYGYTRCLLFISTMLFVQMLLSYISLDDLIALPFSIHKKKAIILSKALFTVAVRSVVDLELHLKLLPQYQKKHLSIKQWFRFKLTLSLALILMLLRESKQKGELIDNRVKHCF